MYVYGDVILAINIVINVIIFRLTSWLTGVRATWWRIAAGAVIGATYALASAFPLPHFTHGLGFKLLLAALLVFIVFGRLRLRALIKLWLVFLLVSFVLGGVVVALSLMTMPAGPALVVPSPSGAVLLAGISLGVVLMLVVWRCLQLRLERMPLRYRLVLGCDGQEAVLSAIMDTGNTLRTVMRRQPVAIVQYAAIRHILDKDMQAYLDALPPGDWALHVDKLAASGWLSRLAVIPYRTVGVQHGVLLGIRMDYLDISAANQRKIRIPSGIAALDAGGLADPFGADALLPVALLYAQNTSDLPEGARSCVCSGQ